MAGKHEGLKNEINRGSTEKRQDAILMTSSHRQKCLWPGLNIPHKSLEPTGTSIQMQNTEGKKLNFK